MKSIVKTAKTVDDAVALALNELGVDLDEVNIEIIKEAKSGFLGIGARNAVVKVTIKEEAGVPDLDALEKDLAEIDQILEEEEEKEEDQDQKPADKVQKPEEKVMDEYLPSEDKKEAGEEVDQENEEESKEGLGEEDDRVEEDLDEGGDEEEDSLDDTPSPQPVEEELLEEETPAPVPKKIQSPNQALTFIEDFLQKTLDYMQLQGRPEAVLSGDTIRIEVVDIDDVETGILIGRRGETLNAIQYITALALNRKTNKHYRIYLDVAGYRERRKNTLIRSARSKAHRVQKNHKPISLEPMNSYERRIIHTALQDEEGIYTESEGREPRRRVVIRNKN